MPSRVPSRAGLAVLAVVAVLALSAAAATFDAVDRPAPDVTAPDADPDRSPGSTPDSATADPGSSIGGLATPFEWRTDLDADAPGPGSGGLAVPLALALLVVCAVGVVAFLTGSDETVTRDRGEPEDAAVPHSTEQPRWPVDADENAVYRSWRRFADRLDAPPSRSPAEIAAAARDRGLDARVVGELTATFREVRYGDRPATREREERATAARDRLEDDA